jgi:uncharacterized protein YbjQ (UPF0145 family)
VTRADAPAVPPEAIVTFESAEGFRVLQRLGEARGEARCARNILRATFRSIGAFIGLAPLEYLTDAERARGECLAALLAHAAQLGANGILGLRFEAVESIDGTHVRAIGDAVLLDPAPGASAGSTPG